MTRDWTEIYKVIESTIVAEYGPVKDKDKIAKDMTPKILVALRDAGYKIACRESSE